MSVRKCLLVGDGGTGKTSLIKRLLTGEFSSSYSATVGYEVHRLTVSPEASSTKFTLHVWDVSGQTSSGPLLELILNGAHCAIIVFDITSRVTFNNVAVWYRDIVRVCGPDIPVTVVGNKIDVPNRKINMETMFRKFPNSVKCCEISVKTNHNVDKPIQWIADQLLKRSRSDVIVESLRAALVPKNPQTLEKQLADENKAASQKAALTPLPAEDMEDNLKTELETNLEERSRRPRRHRAQKSSSETSSNEISENCISSQRASAKQSKKKGCI